MYFHKILVMLSGGLDSTYCAWKALVETKAFVHLHHINMINADQRHQAEARACMRITAWLAANTRSFKYTESTVDLESLGPSFGMDEDVVIFIASRVAIGMLPVTIWEGTTKDDLDTNPTVIERWEKRGDIPSFLERCAWQDPDQIKIEFPAIGKTKREIWEELPGDLKGKTWSCRRPENHFTACGECKPCKELEWTRRSP